MQFRPGFNPGLTCFISPTPRLPHGLDSVVIVPWCRAVRYLWSVYADLLSGEKLHYCVGRRSVGDGGANLRAIEGFDRDAGTAQYGGEARHVFGIAGYEREVRRIRWDRVPVAAQRGCQPITADYSGTGTATTAGTADVAAAGLTGGATGSASG
ncbi:hypothetical protein [Nocardia stercoris]|uniref:hypothetical protein n=1 Tax=Nocardia stercoris TaxID=2483361 RepID=UPI0011C3D335|nr:hypothetical protein [Nocardia stercoris]